MRSRRAPGPLRLGAFMSWTGLHLSCLWCTGCGAQEEYIKEEQRNLKRELLRAQEEVKRIQSVPLVIGQFLEMVDTAGGIVGSTTGSNYYVRILSTLNRELLKPSASVALHRHSNALVDILPPEADSSISLLSQSERPDVTYQARASASLPYNWCGFGTRICIERRVLPVRMDKRAWFGGVGWEQVQAHCSSQALQQAVFCQS